MLKRLTNVIVKKYVESKIKGISLITLLVVIVVMLILSSTIIITVTSNDGGIFSAYEARYKSDLYTIKEKINTYKIEANIDPNYDKQELDYMTTYKVNKIIDISQYKDKIGVYDNKNIYLTNDKDTIDARSAQDLGYKIVNMTPDEFKYYVELGIIESKIDKINLVGRSLLSSDFNETIQIDNVTYGNGWYLIGNYTDEEKNDGTYNKHYEILGITDITHAPYLVNYKTGEVLSIPGMVMYSDKILVHSFYGKEVYN